MTSLVPVLPGLHAHCSGALWLSDTRTAIVADLHLGYGWAQRRRGELGPLADFRARDKLLAALTDLQPAEVVFLGDLVHAPRPCGPEREWIETTLTEISQRCSLVAVRGNHDRAFAREFGHLPLKTVEFWSNHALTAIHGDRLANAPVPEAHMLVVGHLHPCLPVRDASGASQHLPVFLVNNRCLVLPAFSPFARGYNLLSGLPPELQACFGTEPIVAYAATTTRVVRLGPLNQAVEKMFEADRSTPAQFRRRSAGQ